MIRHISDTFSRSASSAMSLVMYLVMSMAMMFATSSCAQRPNASPESFEAIRQYGWDMPVTDPEPEWAPASDRVVARTHGGFMVLEENPATKSQQRFTSAENRETHFPVWINEGEVVFGPGRN